MKTHLAPSVQNTPEGREAEEIVRKCVHCGFCTATCPTYQLLGDELDGPRGRIYLIKQVLEGVEPTQRTQLHLDRCLTCRACETTCPSGVQYGRLLDIGRKLVDEKVQRPIGDRLARATLRHGLPSKAFQPALKLGQALRPLLPSNVRAKVPVHRAPGVWPTRSHAQKMLLPVGCVQPAMSPGIDAATARVLDVLHVQAIPVSASCCGAIKHHLSDHEGALVEARRNIDAWWPYIEDGVEAIVMNASGCGAMVKEYAHLLRHEPAYAEKATRAVDLVRDVCEVLADSGAELQRMQRSATPERVVFHPPCTLQHAQKIRGSVEALLTKLGATVLPFPEAHLCCGSAGTYSVLQSQLSSQLRERKLANINAQRPDMILSANIGCIAHLAGTSNTPVRHWIEWVDSRIHRP